MPRSLQSVRPTVRDAAIAHDLTRAVATALALAEMALLYGGPYEETIDAIATELETALRCPGAVVRFEN